MLWTSSSQTASIYSLVPTVQWGSRWCSGVFLDVRRTAVFHGAPGLQVPDGSPGSLSCRVARPQSCCQGRVVEPFLEECTEVML